MKKIFALTLAALLLVSIFAGCSLSPQTSESQVNVPVVTDIDREAVVATVGDKTVTMGDYIDLFDSYASYYTSYGYDLYSDPAAWRNSRISSSTSWWRSRSSPIRRSSPALAS